MNLFKIGTSRRRSLGDEDASKQGRNLKQRSILEESDFDVQDMLDEDYELAAGLRAEAKELKISSLGSTVDDILLIGNNVKMLQEVKSWLCILKYLRNTQDMVLVYGAKPEAELKVSCYDVASFQTDKDDTKSQTGYVRRSSNKRPMEMLCDDEYVIAIANDPGILKGAGHFHWKYHYIREVIQEREIVLKKVHTYDNVADPFTKPMPFNKHYEHAMAIDIVPASSFM
nr:hypothetical protein [Tanacetum cinerariifolium]